MHSAMPRNDALLASARCGMAVLTPEGTWIAVNPALCRLLGEDVAELEATAAHRRLFPDDAERIDAMLAQLADGAAMRLGLGVGYRHPHGESRQFELDVDRLPTTDGDGAGVLLQLHDVTAAARAKADLDALGLQQQQLAYGISHDLRAALRSIEGFSAQLQQQPLDAQGRDHLARVRASAAHAGGLVDALVSLSRASSAAYAHAPVDLSLLATWVAAELQDADPQRAAEIAVQPGLEAQGDERHLKLLLEHLMRNAWTFTPREARVEIDVSGQRRDDGRLELCVRDHGSGFDMRYLDKLFVPFRRLHGTDDGGGFGLGLATVQAIARRHGGRAWAQSQPGAGSRFYVELPVPHARSER